MRGNTRRGGVICNTSTPDKLTAQVDAPSDLIGGRYRVEDQLGRGGMAYVYRVRDISSGQALALKRLMGDREQVEANAALLAREYYTLRQLAHPRIIEVYEYGFDGAAPYYTMELLTGQDLAAGAPFEWTRAAQLLLSVASSLSMLHSRRLIHRDVSAGNVRIAPDGTAKLIDFGAMIEMGAARQLIGTVPYVPPEALNQQLLDERVDLYALGALAYLMLTGRHAYPARDYAQLRELWMVPPPRVQALNPEVPEALSRLIADLLEPEPWARPSSAAEVMERLSAIAGLPLGEAVAVRQAYLTTPRLVGRDLEVDWLRLHVARASAGHGAGLLVRGASGVGRSRLLDACVLEAKLAGLTVLRADATDARDFAALRGLLDQLWLALPAAREQAPEELAQPTRSSVLEVRRPQLQTALQAFLLALADRHGLVLAVDDLQAVAIYRSMLARLDQPDRAGHEPTLHRYVRLAFVYACAHNEAGLGMTSALARADELQADPLHELNALSVRGNYYLSQGDALRAESCRQQVELLEIRNAPLQFFDGHDAYRYSVGHAAMDDLPNIKRMSEIIEGLAQRYPGWIAVRHYAAGEYARTCS